MGIRVARGGQLSDDRTTPPEPTAFLKRVAAGAGIVITQADLDTGLSDDQWAYLKAHLDLMALAYALCEPPGGVPEAPDGYAPTPRRDLVRGQYEGSGRR